MTTVGIPQEFRMETLPEPEQKTFDEKPFPLILVPGENENRNVTQWCNFIRNEENRMKKLLAEYGAILFRGFPVGSAEDFDSFSKAFGHPHFPYIGGAAPRHIVTGNVATANEAPPSHRIQFHHEIAQMPVWPKLLFFYCDIAPPQGGQTSLLLSNVVYRHMKKREPEFVEKIEKEGVIYRRVLPDGDDSTSAIGRGWQSTFLTDDPEEAEERCRERNTRWNWLEDGSMETISAGPMPAIREDERSGKKMWHNSIMHAYLTWTDSRNQREKSITFADGSPMSEEVINQIQDVMDTNCIDFTWKKGDVVIVDNRMCLHGRRWFKPPRRILAVLCG